MGQRREPWSTQTVGPRVRAERAWETVEAAIAGNSPPTATYTRWSNNAAECTAVQRRASNSPPPSASSSSYPPPQYWIRLLGSWTFLPMPALSSPTPTSHPCSIRGYGFPTLMKVSWSFLLIHGTDYGLNDAWIQITVSFYIFFLSIHCIHHIYWLWCKKGKG